MILAFDTDKLPPIASPPTTPTTQTINIGDDDERGVAITTAHAGDAQRQRRNGFDEYTVVLTSQPTATVTVTPSTDEHRK